MSKFGKSGHLVLLVLVGTSFLLGMVMFLKTWKDLPTEQLTRDSNAILDAPLYVSFLSQVGIFIWSGAAMVCLYSSRLIPRMTGNDEARHFLLMSGLIMLLLGLDDVFLLHEQFFPFMGIPEKVVYGIYAGLILFLLIRFNALILSTEYPVLAMGLFFFGLSVSLDWFQPERIDIFLLEDGAKLTGILSWLTYFLHRLHLDPTGIDDARACGDKCRGKCGGKVIWERSARNGIPFDQKRRAHAQLNSPAYDHAWAEPPRYRASP